MSNYHDVDDFNNNNNNNNNNSICSNDNIDNDVVNVREIHIKSTSTPELNNAQFTTYQKKKFVRNLIKLFKSQSNINDESLKNSKQCVNNEKKIFSAAECMKNINDICKNTWKQLSVKNSNNSQINKKHSFNSSNKIHEMNLFRKKNLCNTPSFFFPNISREHAEFLLSGHEDGVFLMRNSIQYPDKLTLSLIFNTKFEHYLVETQDKQFSLNKITWFDSITKLIIHHQLNDDGLATLLTVGLSSQEIPLKYNFKMNLKLIIPFNEIKLKDFIGEGEFGVVRKGEWNKKEIAIKQTKSDDLMKGLIQEATLMSKLNHKNLVQLYGITIQSIVLLITEYMSTGDLLHYLQTRGRAVIKRKELVKFACDISCGMSYLEKNKIIHCDLCACNILLSENAKDAKISDFGLSKNLKDIKNDTSSNKLRIRWTAPEVLENKNFTLKADVWSFGILLWEIYSYGRIPYPGLKLDSVKEFVKTGNRMKAPEECPFEIYEIMCSCWNLNWKLRPKFDILEKAFLKIYEKTTD